MAQVRHRKPMGAHVLPARLATIHGYLLLATPSAVAVFNISGPVLKTGPRIVAADALSRLHSMLAEQQQVSMNPSASMGTCCWDCCCLSSHESHAIRSGTRNSGLWSLLDGVSSARRLLTWQRLLSSLMQLIVAQLCCRPVKACLLLSSRACWSSQFSEFGRQVVMYLKASSCAVLRQDDEVATEPAHIATSQHRLVAVHLGR